MEIATIVENSFIPNHIKLKTTKTSPGTLRKIITHISNQFSSLREIPISTPKTSPSDIAKKKPKQILCIVFVKWKRTSFTLLCEKASIVDRGLGNMFGDMNRDRTHQIARKRIIDFT